MSRDFDYNFCPQCGNPMKEALPGPDEPVRRICLGCGLKIHPDPKVAVASLIFQNGRVLLLKRSRPPAREKWCLPGGFVDRGETLEDAAVREVGEETGLEVRIDRLFGLYSYPGYPVVVAIFQVEILGGRLAINDESRTSSWFAPDEIPWDDLAFPSTRDSLQTWRDQVIS